MARSILLGAKFSKGGNGYSDRRQMFYVDEFPMNAGSGIGFENLDPIDLSEEAFAEITKLPPFTVLDLATREFKAYGRQVKELRRFEVLGQLSDFVVTKDGLVKRENLKPAPAAK